MTTLQTRSTAISIFFPFTSLTLFMLDCESDWGHLPVDDNKEGNEFAKPKREISDSQGGCQCGFLAATPLRETVVKLQIPAPVFPVEQLNRVALLSHPPGHPHMHLSSIPPPQATPDVGSSTYTLQTPWVPS